MRVVARNLALVLTLLGVAQFVEAELPPESQEILDKLKQFEAEQLGMVQQNTGRKRLAVAESLKAMAVSETKRGDLEKANAINDCRLQLEDSAVELAEIFESKSSMPGEARGLLVKLADYQQEAENDFQTLLNEKRTAVVEILSGHLKQAIQQGDLDAANALKTSAERIADSLPSTSLAANQAPSPNPQIPEDAVRHQGHYYKVYKMDRLLSWEDARRECRKLGGELGWIDGEDGVKKIRALMKPFLDEVGHAPIWIGAHRTSAGEWEWLDGTKFDSGLWPDDEDSSKNPNNNYMLRWVGKYRAAAIDAPQPKGYLCRWE
ncbi:MAG: C-type lectin domain-containing protein [Verrucomicrobiota bacterium]